jgi:hypothetical protein
MLFFWETNIRGRSTIFISNILFFVEKISSTKKFRSEF